MGKKTRFALEITVVSIVVWLLTVLLFTEEFVFTKPDSSSEAVAPAGELVDGTFQGTTEGHNGPLSVEVVVANGAIEAVNVIEHVETAGIADPALEQIPAAIVASSSTEVEAISGATVTSEAIKNATNIALTGDVTEEATPTPVPIPEEESEEVESIEQEVDSEESEVAESDSAESESIEESEESQDTSSEESTDNEATSETLTFEDGTFEGIGEGHEGDVKVEVVVENNVIKEINILDHEETDGIADPALEEVPQAIIDANSVDVDTVSGATFTSNAIITAVKEALDISDDAIGEYKDGTYTASAEGHEGPIEVEVIIEDGNIKEINIVESSETKGISDAAFDEVPKAIIEANQTDVDTASGATVSSEAIIEAVEKALQEATE